MDGERKINLCEGVPLNTSGAANILINSANTRPASRDGTVIHLKTERPTDVGVHINTTLSIASSKKIKFLFVFNFLLSVICMVISCSIAFYYWNEFLIMRRQLDYMKEQYLNINFNSNHAKAEASPLVYEKPNFKGIDVREPKMESGAKIEMTSNPRKYFVEHLGEDMLLVDSSKKNPKVDKEPVYDLSLTRNEPVIAHFNGGLKEANLGSQSIVGPWVRDVEISSKNSEAKIELNTNYVTIKEDGLYLVYAQVVYLTHAPNSFFVWARQPNQEPRLISACASADDSSSRPLSKSQISCSVHTLARLHNGDIVNIAQREPNRTLWLRPGYSYFGFIKISS